MQEYTLLKEDNPLLRTKSKPVTNFTNIGTLLDSMYTILKKELFCTGISAPQIGEMIRVSIVKHSGKVYEFINPTITFEDKPRITRENCLSVYDRSEWDVRSNIITVEYQDRHGVNHSTNYKGAVARYLQHEIDHLNGRLI